MDVRVPLGIESFAELRKDNYYYYIDKTAFIKELLGKKFKACLVTRPRRFGKSLTMGMLEVLIATLCKRYAFLGNSDRVDEGDKDIFTQLKSRKADTDTEYGTGRPDIVITDDDLQRAIVIEVKYAKTEGEIESKFKEARKQFAERRYLEGVPDDYTEKIGYSAVFFSKKCFLEEVTGSGV